MKLDDNTLGIWFVQVRDDADWLASVRRSEKGGHDLEYRFRYYGEDSADPFDGKDEKSWYGGHSDKFTDEQAIASLRTAAESLSEVSGGQLYECLRGERTAREFFEEFRKLPFVHEKVLQ
jgi:hypothetical protein